jgi:hypothetical protein
MKKAARKAASMGPACLPTTLAGSGKHKADVEQPIIF